MGFLAAALMIFRVWQLMLLIKAMIKIAILILNIFQKMNY